VLLLAGAAIALVALPPLLALLLVGRRELRRHPAPASWKWSALLVMALSIVPIAAALVDVPSLIAQIARHSPALFDRLAAVVAGALWGGFALTIGAWVFAPIHGLERIRHDALWPLLRSWTALALLRAAALSALHVPVLVLVLRACSELGVPGLATLASLPAAGLLTHFWLLSLVDNLSIYLDVKLTSGPPTPRNPWHATVKRYFRGYVQRGVIVLDERLVERTLFLPSSRADVVCYGGGFARPRIAVGQKPLETALGELPDEEEFPDRSANPEELPFGLVVPGMTAETEEARAEHWRHRLTIAPPRLRAHVPRLLGENATLLGWVLPQPTEKGIPLISDTEEDFGVVKRLLSEHYGAFAGSHDDEVDDTDPRQKDFLFGALLCEMGVVARHDVLFATIARTIETLAGKGWLSHGVRLPVTLYQALLAGPGAKVADAYAALNGALHYLIQYLCLACGAEPDLLTARASVPRLMQTSREMMARVDRKTPAAARVIRGAGPRDRAAWLVDNFYGPLAPPGVPWVRALGGAVLVALGAALLFRYASAAVAYHPVYEARMKSQQAAAMEGQSR
jgi:hypothetical protein